MARAHLPWGLALLQRDACHSRQLFRIALPGYVHIEGWRVGAQQMVMHGRDLQAFGQQLRHHGIDFGFGQHEIAHHHERVAHGFEGDPASEREAGLDRYAIERDFEIGSRKAVAMNGSRHRSRTAKDQIDFLPVRIGRKSRRGAEAKKGFYRSVGEAATKATARVDGRIILARMSILRWG